MNAENLKVEYLTAPIGIDVQNPRLQWTCAGGIKQSAYRIITEKWDSGKVISPCMYAEYPLNLEDREQVHWKVCLWDENDVAGGWRESCFEMGISEWSGKWISGSYSVDKNKRYPVDCFRKSFAAANVKSARLYITACGVYEACINGSKAGNFILAPGITDYRKRVQYQTIDVTELIIDGENIITVQLADGWYRGCCGAWGIRNQYGTQTKLLLQLEMTLTDGTVEKIVSDESWDWSNDGPIRMADNKDGEIICAYMTPSYAAKAMAVKHRVIPTASNNVPVTEHEQFKARKIITSSGKTVLDFGQNIAGYIAFKLSSHKGWKIKLRFGELLDSKGEFTQKNFQLSGKKKTTPLQQILYECREGENEYKTTFAIFGFQYAEVESDMDINPDDFTAIAVYSDMESTSTFRCSNELVNKLYKATLWSAKNNSCDLPTDCPTRERHGWSGDAQIFCGTASYLFNYRGFIRKFINDLKDGQHKDGNIGQIAPYGGVDLYMKVMDGSPGWSDAIVLIPWTIYKQYGDIRILKECYDSMRRYADYKMKTVGKWYPTAIPTGVGLKYAGSISNYGQSYGEWAEPADVCAFKIRDFISPHPEETTAYIVYLMEHMVKIADLLGEDADIRKYQACADKVRAGYQRLVETKKYSLDTDRQAKQVRPLYMKLLNETQDAFARKRLIKSLDNYGWRLGTGFLSTPFILPVLTDINPEWAYKLLENEEIPGWLAMPKNGANTIWEAWEGPNSTGGGIGSLNHYSKGAVMEWVFNTMCGINVDGERKFRIVPVPGADFTYAAMVYDSIYGRVVSGWKKENDNIIYNIEIPSNCTADLVIAGNEQLLGPGKYSFTCNRMETR